MFKNRAAWREAISDTIIGTIINFPLNVLAMWFIFKAQMGVFMSSAFLWLMFTSVAIVRKYCLRVYFEKKSKTIVDSDK
jgi:hypothetical protein